MNIDERIEALVQSLELLTHDVRSLEVAARAHESRLGSHDRLLGEIMEATARLLHVAEIHEHRIDRLENQ